MRVDLERAVPLLGVLLALGCQADRLLTPVDELPTHPGLEEIAVWLEVDVEQGMVRVLPAHGIAQDSGGPSLAILGSNEVGVSVGNLVRSAPVNNKVSVTFDAALTNRLTSASLVPSTFPGSTAGAGLLLFPFRVTQVVGGTAGQVVAGADWNGDGSAGSGAPRNFFNDFGCGSTATTSDCFRWEQYPAPLGPGETTAAQKVGFTIPKAITSFQVLLVLAADVRNDLPAVAAIAVTPSSYVMNDGFPATFTAEAYDAQNHPLSWPTLTWTTADITALEFQSGGSLVGTITGGSQVVHGRKVGVTSFTVRSGGISVVIPVDIQVNTVALVQLMTPDSSLTAGDQVQGDARVKDHSGQIIPGLLPTWSTTDPNVITVDQNGLITAVGAGTADVIATAGNQSAAVTIVVGRLIAGDLAGTMRDSEGQPVKGATLTATGFTGAFTTTTGDDGSYRFHNLPITGTGVYLLQWSPAGCTAGAQNRIVLQVGGVITVDIDTDCPASVSGVVNMVVGTMPAGVAVELRLQAGGSTRVGVVQSDGSYSITGVPSGTWFITMTGFTANCTVDFAQVVTLSQQTHFVKNFDANCQPIGWIAGTVRDLDGQPIGNVFAEMIGRTNNQLFQAYSDGDGIFNFNLPADIYDVTFSKEGSCSSVTRTYTVNIAVTTPASPFVDCPWRLTGKVTALGGSLPLPLTVFVGSLTSIQERGSVASDGTYQIDEFPNPNGSSGDLTLNLFDVPTRCAVTSGPFAVTVTQQMQLQLADWVVDCRPASFHVLVTDGWTNANPQPLIGMAVRLVGSSLDQSGTTGQSGVSFPTADVGGNLISIGQGTHGCSGNSTVVTAQPNTHYSVVIPVSCPTTGALQGTLRTALGNPLPNINIVVGTYSLTTDQNGHWGVAGLPAGLLFINPLGPWPSGCTGPGAVQAAVIPQFTITTDLTANCSGF